MSGKSPPAAKPPMVFLNRDLGIVDARHRHPRGEVDLYVDNRRALTTSRPLYDVTLVMLDGGSFESSIGYVPESRISGVPNARRLVGIGGLGNVRGRYRQKLPIYGGGFAEDPRAMIDQHHGRLFPVLEFILRLGDGSIVTDTDNRFFNPTLRGPDLSASIAKALADVGALVGGTAIVGALGEVLYSVNGHGHPDTAEVKDGPVVRSEQHISAVAIRGPPSVGDFVGGGT